MAKEFEGDMELLFELFCEAHDFGESTASPLGQFFEHNGKTWAEATDI